AAAASAAGRRSTDIPGSRSCRATAQIQPLDCGQMNTNEQLHVEQYLTSRHPHRRLSWEPLGLRQAPQQSINVWCRIVVATFSRPVAQTDLLLYLSQAVKEGASAPQDDGPKWRKLPEPSRFAGSNPLAPAPQSCW